TGAASSIAMKTNGSRDRSQVTRRFRDQLSRLAPKLAQSQWPSPLRPIKPLLGQAALLLGYKYEIPLSKLVAAWIHGFYGDKAILYDFGRHTYDSYVSDFARHTRTARINRDRGYILNDKFVFFCVLNALGVPTPQIFAEQSQGKLRFLGGT